jgi:hypothetical protein
LGSGLGSGCLKCKGTGDSARLGGARANAFSFFSLRIFLTFRSTQSSFEKICLMRSVLEVCWFAKAYRDVAFGLQSSSSLAKRAGYLHTGAVVVGYALRYYLNSSRSLFSFMVYKYEFFSSIYTCTNAISKRCSSRLNSPPRQAPQGGSSAFTSIKRSTT